MDEHDGEPDRRTIDRARFRVDTTINIAHILTTVAMIMAVMSWGSDLRATVQRHDGEIADIKQNMRDDRQVLREELREIDRKIGKIAERVGAVNK